MYHSQDSLALDSGETYKSAEPLSEASSLSESRGKSSPYWSQEVVCVPRTAGVSIRL
jgi:hypothetical protein